ncbi:protein transport protein Sec31A isoform X7 [Spea bombifrons]|uniref:protein transport protein Sec31A isoform X7 n=1 Tax=Spea bombifrons TaxID=233779 RepID=UPI002349AFAC|nr:protein transport protein Sec31A isoform X7 [Spea bombifrons]
MKLKEIDRTAMQAWSPSQHHPIYLATGTSAQQLDATFSTNASLEIFELDLTDHSLDMKSSATFSSAHRYHKLIWGPYKMNPDASLSGVLIAGGENGNVILYDPTKILAGDSDVVIAQQDKHTGPVRALDVNAFQTNLVASGANESEIYIWDLNNFAVPMTPGAKSQPPEDISCIAWNRQVQHILASTSPSGRATVWDLRKNEPILKVSDHSNRMHCSGMAWHPDVATQMVLSSEDDRLPVIQMWDLRFASSPLRVMENHTRGILAIAWSNADPELLLSCGKDSRILCSNPNTGEVLYELPTSTQWCFDIQWCPRNPAVLSAASFDGRIGIYSIMGGMADNLSQKQADQLSSSFGNMDPFGTGQPLPPLQLPQQPAKQSTVLPLKKPPKWLRRPVGASFSFGGKLITFEATKQQPPQQQQHPQAPNQPFHVYVSQVVTEKEFLNRSNKLQDVVSTGAFLEYCQKKIEDSKTDFEKNVWSFLKVNFEDDSRGKYLELLGFRKEDLVAKIASALSNSTIAEETHEDLKKPDQALESDDEGSQPTDDQFLGEISNTEKDENSDSISAGETFNISVSGDVDGLITQALLTGNFESAVDLCLHDNRMADAIILAIAGGPDLLARTQTKYFAKSQSKITRLITAVVTKNWKEIVQSCDLQNWREALAAVLTYAKPEEFSALCDLLGSRLEKEGDGPLQAQACLCYICAGNVEKLVACWTRAQEGTTPLSLQDLIEKVVILRRAVQVTQAVETKDVGALLAEKMSQYANLLAAQGSLAAAMAFLPVNTNQLNIMHLRDRLSRAQGEDGLTPTASVTRGGGVAVGPQHGPSCMQPGRDAKYYPQARIAPTVTSWSNKIPTAQSGCSSAAASYDTQRDHPPAAGFNIPGNLYPSAPATTGPPPPPQPDSGTVSYNFNSHMGPRQPYPQRPQNGWNDPPALSRTSKKKVLENYVPPPPITAPIMNPIADSRSQQQQVPVSASSVPSVPFQPSSASSVQPGAPNLFSTMQPHVGQPGVYLDPSKANKDGVPGATIGNNIQAIHTLPAEKITKNPIPEEHLILKSTFEALIQRCLSSAVDQQTKRKLDEANKRLESLYDKLREQTLSPAIIAGLHSIARSIESRNYMEGLNIHTHIVSTSNFSETSAFMPVLKVVLTQANKLGV